MALEEPIHKKMLGGQTEDGEILKKILQILKHSKKEDQEDPRQA